MNFHKKVIVVTGARTGMGRELTKQLVEKGAEVAMVDINLKGLEETAEIVGTTNISIHQLSIAERSLVESLPEQVIAAHGQVDELSTMRASFNHLST